MFKKKSSLTAKTAPARLLGGLGVLLLVALMFGALWAGPVQVQAQTTPETQTTPSDPTPQTAPTPEPTTPGVPNLQDTTDLKVDEGNTNASDNEKELSGADLAQLKAIEGGAIQGPQLEQLKTLAAEKIAQYGPKVIERLDAKAKDKADTRLLWVAIVIIGVIPGLALIIFLVYPLIKRKTIHKRAPGVTMGKVYRLYVPQAILVTLVLVGLGCGLYGVQYLTGRLLGGVTNPQLVFQKSAIQHIIDDRVQLVNDYSDMFIGLAEDITNADPEKPIMETILENALQLKDDPLVNTANDIVKFVMPFLNYISLVSFGLLVLFFLIRIRPDIMRLLTYPIDILEAEQKGQPLPDFDSVASGTIVAGSNPSSTMRQIGRRLMWTEVKVIGVFALAVLAVAAIMSLVLYVFFSQIVALVVDSMYTAAENFLYTDNASGPLLWSTIILLVFVVECVVVFLCTFIFALIRVQGAIRLRFGEQISWKQTWDHLSKVSLRFGWVMLLLIVMGIGLPYLATQADDILYKNIKDANYALILLAIPTALLVGMTVLLWLLRGFKIMVSLLTKSAAKDLGLPGKPGKKIEATPAGV